MALAGQSSQGKNVPDPLSSLILFVSEQGEAEQERERLLYSLCVSGDVFHQDDDSCIEAANWG